MANNIDDLTLRSWVNISGILGPRFIEVIKKNRITLRKTLNKAKKFPGFLVMLRSSLSPRNGSPCFPKKRMARTIWRIMYLFSSICIWISLLAITSIREAGLSILFFMISVYCTQSRGYRREEWLLKAFPIFDQLE